LRTSHSNGEILRLRIVGFCFSCAASPHGTSQTMEQLWRGTTGDSKSAADRQIVSSSCERSRVPETVLQSTTRTTGPTYCTILYIYSNSTVCAYSTSTHNCRPRTAIVHWILCAHNTAVIALQSNLPRSLFCPFF